MTSLLKRCGTRPLSRLEMNKTFSTTIDDDGVLLIPEEVLDAYGWEEGTELSVRVLECGSLEIKKHDPLTETDGK